MQNFKVFWLKLLCLHPMAVLVGLEPLVGGCQRHCGGCSKAGAYDNCVFGLTI